MNNNNMPRFVEVYSQKVAGVNRILVDTLTGVNYFFHKDGDGYAGGLTPLLNPNGTPIITPPEMFQQPR